MSGFASSSQTLAISRWLAVFSFFSTSVTTSFSFSRTGPGDRMIDTFLVEMNETGDKGQRTISRWWISPADKFAIRYDFSDGAGKANRAVVTEVTR